jgi:hypothetical protein
MEASLCYCDYEPFEFYHREEPTARKTHCCCECSSEIQPGERYEKAVGKFDGIFESYKTCLPCSCIRRDYCAAYGALREVIWESLETDYITGEMAFDDDEPPQEEL